MFRWYCNATQCYVYLPDVSIPSLDRNDDKKTYGGLSRAVNSIFSWSGNATRPINSNDEYNPRP